MGLVISPALHKTNDSLSEFFEILTPKDSKGTIIILYFLIKSKLKSYWNY